MRRTPPHGDPVLDALAGIDFGRRYFPRGCRDRGQFPGTVRSRGADDGRARRPCGVCRGRVMTAGWIDDIRTSYDNVAVSYLEFVRDLLDDAPYERAAFALFADQVRAAGGGPVADVGCGPGRITGL